ncbi:MAG: LysR family transcriptional regulator [Candidatus Sphingomonas phytovorans]|nr:LysR family transcriptional regulator [Sphingomonas sp.]WEK00944.1 MAG: LysR family transcriptional regulator [Sphingomonas sp.]
MRKLDVLMHIIHYVNVAMLDPRLLQAFVAIAEHGGFTSAATALNMTQSTISQQLARLEEAVGQRLIDRSARPVMPTPAGERLLGHARRILALQAEAAHLLADPAGSHAVGIGVAEDILTPAMAGVFAAFSEMDRAIRLDVTTGLSRDLSRRYRNGEFDVIVVKEPLANSDCRAFFVEPMAWFESASATRDWPDPIPLVTFPPGALYREEMFERIEREKRRWYIGFTGNSLSSVLVAVEAGMGISLLPCLSTQGRDVRIHRALGEEQPMAVALYAWEASGRIGQLVAEMVVLLAWRSAQYGS